MKKRIAKKQSVKFISLLGYTRKEVKNLNREEFSVFIHKASEEILAKEDVDNLYALFLRLTDKAEVA